jgi:D-serine deaminase-like pyridoxal phosphate-dependent protein
MTTALSDSERVSALAELVSDTPSVVVDIGVVRANVNRAAAVAAEAGVALRPHTKTHKLPQIAQLQVKAGAAGIQVAKLGEAEVMVEGGILDVLVGYPIVGEQKLARLISLAERSRLTVSLDSLEVAQGISAATVDAGLEIGLLVELDTGLRRLGRAPGKDGADLGEAIASLPGVWLEGVYTHEGHVYGAVGGPVEKERMTRDACARTVETAEEIRSRGIEVRTVSVGSAGTFRFAVECPGVTEVRPGTYVFNDRSQIEQGAASAHDVAAFVVATVVSRPTAERIVIDAGSKVLSSDRILMANPPTTFGDVIGHRDWSAARLSEEHGVIEVPASAKVSVGARVLIMPNHICPVINLANELTIVEDGVVVDQWPVAARGRVQ